jgi:6-phosphogluconate dehydrogenase
MELRRSPSSRRILRPATRIIDLGNSNYKDTMRRAAALAERKLNFVDSGTSE